MRSLKTCVTALSLMLAVAACMTDAPGLTDVALAKGFDQFGYNSVANAFNGRADGVDNALDGMVWGDSTYANDHLVMKWNDAWENCNANRSPENCRGAWISNNWNGKVPGGSDQSWRYMIVWYGPCGADGTPLPDGSYCLWGEYKVLMSQGSIAGGHFWEAHARPTGLGLKN